MSEDPSAVLIAPFYSRKMMRESAEQGARPLKCEHDGCERRVIVHPIGLSEVRRLGGVVWCPGCSADSDVGGRIVSTPALEIAYGVMGHSSAELAGWTPQGLARHVRDQQEGRVGS